MRLTIAPWKHPKTGRISWRVSGSIVDEGLAQKLKVKPGRVRKNFLTEEKAIEWVQVAESLTGRRTRDRVRTWIKQADIPYLEAALEELGDAEQVLHAARKWRKERELMGQEQKLSQMVEDYLSTKRNPDGPHVVRTRNRLKQGGQKAGLKSTRDLLGDGLTKWLTRSGVSGTALRNDWVAWHGFCRWLVARELLPRNPVTLIARPRRDTPPPRVLSNEEFWRLMECAKASPMAPYLVPYYGVCTWAGLRPQSEWPHLSWDSVLLDVAQEYRCIRVSRQKNERMERYVRVFPVLEKCLRQWRDDEWPLGGWEMWGDTSLERSLRKAHEEARQMAGIEWQTDLLRHTYASNAIHYFSRGELRDQMGTQESTIARYYIRPGPPEARAAFWGVK